VCSGPDTMIGLTARRRALRGDAITGVIAACC